MKAKTYYIFLKDLLHDLEWSSKELRKFCICVDFDNLTDYEKDCINRSKIILDNSIQSIRKKLGATTTAPKGINNQ